MPFYDLDGAPAPIEDLLAHLFGVFHDKRCNAVHQCVRQALLDRLLAPGQVFFLARTAALDALGQFHTAFGGRTPVGGIGLTDWFGAVEHEGLAHVDTFGLDTRIDDNPDRLDATHAPAVPNCGPRESR